MDDQYLGDGVYASFDGYHVILDLRGQDSTTKIFMDKEVLDALFRYKKFVEQTIKEEQSNTEDDKQ